MRENEREERYVELIVGDGRDSERDRGDDREV